MFKNVLLKITMRILRVYNILQEFHILSLEGDRRIIFQMSCVVHVRYDRELFDSLKIIIFLLVY